MMKMEKVVNKYGQGIQRTRAQVKEFIFIVFDILVICIS